MQDIIELTGGEPAGLSVEWAWMKARYEPDLTMHMFGPVGEWVVFLPDAQECVDGSMGQSAKTEDCL